MRAVQLVNMGYQRLLTFECPDGGFDWYGQPPANVVLSAYAVLEFSDMAKVYEIDERVIERTKRWLLARQKEDGSWDAGERTSWSWPGLQGQLVVTSYVAWCLAEAGERGEGFQRAIAWLRAHAGEAEDNPYLLAMIANALLAVDREDDQGLGLVGRLLDLRRQDEAGVFWQQPGRTLYFAQGEGASVEATALAALALMKTGAHAGTVNRALGWLVARKASNGTWGSTSATVLALKALFTGAGGIEMTRPVNVTVRINGHTETITVAPDQADVMVMRDLTPHIRVGEENRVEVSADGPNSFTYQLVGRHYLPWRLVDRPEEVEPLEIRVEYDRTRLTVDERLRANVRMRYNGSTPTFMIVMDLGVPPGFLVDRSAFEQMVAQGVIDQFSTTARQITLYFGEVQPGQEIEFGYDLVPKYPLRAKAPSAQAWEYYTPEHRAEAEGVEIEVTE